MQGRHAKTHRQPSRRIHLKFPRFSLATIAFAILIVAADLAIVRHVFFSQRLTNLVIFALLLLPMLNVMMIGLYGLRLRERRTARAVGFLIGGSAMTFVIFAFGQIAPDRAGDLLRFVGRPIAGGIIQALTRLVGSAAMQSNAMQLTVGITFEILLPVGLVCLPSIFAALVCGWLASRRDAPGPAMS
jgi:hypothetical protein